MLERMFLAAGDSVATDPDFENVTLLLPGNGTNGAQNNTFLDSSPNNFTITRNGDTTQGSFSPYGDLWSNYFDGTGDYLALPSNTAFALGTGDFTFEAWIWPTVITADFQLIFSASDTNGFNIALNSSGKLTAAKSNVVAVLTSNATISTTQFTHIAVTRSGSTFRMFINGVLDTSNTTTVDFTASNAPRVGYEGLERYFNGYISNLRIVKGTAVYTANFTPPSAPLTAISGTSLLTCQSNRFRDASTNNFAITVNGNTSVTNFAPFNPTAAYDPATNGGSGYWPGTTELAGLTLGTSLLGASDFCFEFWLYVPDLSTSGGTATVMPIVSNYQFYSGTTNASIFIAYTDANQVGFLLYTGGGSNTDNAPGTQLFSGAGSVVRGAWNYITCTRSGATIKIYTNGVERSSGTLASNTAVNFNTRNIYVGRYETISGGAPASTRYFKGYISDFRLVVGSAVYTGNFTPPTAPLSAITNTSRLLRFTNAGIVDASAKNDLVTVGNAQISTAQSKFGGSSMYFDGTGDYLSLASNAALDLTSGDFTVEGWFYCGGLTADTQQIINKDGTYGSSYPQYCVGITSTGKLLAEIGSGSGTSYVQTVVGASTISLNTWNHFAFTKNGSTLRVFLNGAIAATATQSGTMTSGAKALLIGYQTGQPAGAYFNGYIDDLRITKGVARYTANFTPPTAPFADK